MHITQINDPRGGCGILSIDSVKFTSKKNRLINILNNDNNCLLYCIAAALTNKSKWSNLEKSNPENYLELLQQIKASYSKKEIEFPISISEIHELECCRVPKATYRSPNL